jgi:hypothetical protein
MLAIVYQLWFRVYNANDSREFSSRWWTSEKEVLYVWDRIKYTDCDV